MFMLPGLGRAEHNPCPETQQVGDTTKTQTVKGWGSRQVSSDTRMSGSPAIHPRG